MSEIIGGGIRVGREQAGLTQAQLAERAGVSRRTVATIEAGGHVSQRSVERLVAALAAKKPEQPLEPGRIVTGGPPVVKEPAAARTVEIQGRSVTLQVQRYQDLPVVSSQTRWDSVTAVRSALQDFERGVFAGAAEIVEAMLADDRVKGVTSQRVDGLLGLPFDVAPAEEDNAAAAELAEVAKRLWPRIVPGAALRDLWKWGRFLGVGIAEKLYDTASKDGWVPMLKVWHPRYLYWRWDTRSFWLITQDGPVEIPDPNDPDPAKRDAARHWLVYTPFGYGRAGWMEGLIRSLAIPWLFRQFCYRDWGRYNEVHGLPIRAFMEPSEWDDTEKQKGLNEIAKLASESIVRLPQIAGKGGFDLKLIEPTSRSFDSFKLAFEQANASIAIVVLGQNLTSEVKGGAYSAAQVHERVAAAIIRSDSETLSGALREQVLVEWAALNRGAEAAEIAPRPGWDTEPPEDKKASAEALNTNAQAISALRNSQLPVDFAELCERQGIPLLEGVEIGEFEPPAPPSPFGGDEGEGGDDGEDGEEDDPEKGDKKAKAALAATRIAALATRQMLAAGRLGRRTRAPFQGQAYVDELGANGSAKAAALLRGDVRALKQVIANAKAGPDGKVDGAALKTALLEAYAKMKPDQLARVMASCRLLAELSGRYAVTKEVVSR